ncbi:MAG: lipoprotein [Alphaproteobacteria bacterium]|nr:lipoprotein [Alphaproteobacteria bacterium]
MRRSVFGLLAVLALSACAGSVAEFWRPVSEPNILLPLEKAQMKLDFDLSQCQCGIYPTNVPQRDLINFQPDQQRYAETSVTRTLKGSDTCTQQPSLVVAECMRARGWEVTTCSGRMPLAGGGALCAGAVVPD